MLLDTKSNLKEETKLKSFLKYEDPTLQGLIDLMNQHATEGNFIFQGVYSIAGVNTFYAIMEVTT